MKQYCQALPKAEIHLHIEGSLTPQRLFSLAQKNKVQLPYKTIEDVHRAYEFNNLQSFLDIYYAGAKVLLTVDDFYVLGMDYFQKISEDNVKHAEIFFDPQTHTDRGVAFETVITGLDRARQDARAKWGITSHYILCFLRHLPESEAIKTLEHAKPFLSLIKGVGLDSSEKGHPPEKFERVFKMASDLGLLPVAHAGEEGPAEYIWQALEKLKVLRVDHGVRCEEDPRLIEHLVKHQIPLTVCPLSNVKLCVYKNLKDHNLKKLLAKNIMVTINSDDPTYFGGFIGDNYYQTAMALELSKDELKTLAINSFKASWLSPETKQKFIGQINAI